MAGSDGGDLAPPEPFLPLGAAGPTESLDLPLPGLRLRLEPGADDVFARDYADIETLLALHRFSWVPLAGGGEVTSSWVQALWDQWRRAFAKPDDGWAWHPYTAAERAVNLLDFADKKGLPEPVEETVSLLALHADAIFENLEYFGDHNTSNHLSNNGRGLYRLGLALGLAWAADAGARILEQEAARIFMASGVLREGSSHYHLLIARNYADGPFRGPVADPAGRPCARRRRVAGLPAEPSIGPRRHRQRVGDGARQGVEGGAFESD